MTARFNDWERRLAAYIDTVRADVNALGPVPCARFAAGAVEAQTGFDGHAPFKNKYRSELGAARALIRFGAGTLEATFDVSLSRRIGPAFAQRGDIVSNGQAVGVCIGATALFIAEGELVEIARSNWAVAWAVGEVLDE